MRILIFSIILLAAWPSTAQKFYRFKADISVKDKLADGTYRLTMGTVYYDKIYKKIVYDLKFPNKEKLIMQDTTMYKIDADGLLIDSKKVLIIPDFTVFHLALTGQLFDYGLKPKKDERAVYVIKGVQKTSKGIITTWIPSEERYAKYFGRIQMLNKDKRLVAMVFYNVEGEVVSRQSFKKYINVKGVEFPQEVTMISYGEDGTKNIQLTTYKNVVIDQNDQNEIYRYRIPITESLRAIKK